MPLEPKPLDPKPLMPPMPPPPKLLMPLEPKPLPNWEAPPDWPKDCIPPPPPKVPAPPIPMRCAKPLAVMLRTIALAAAAMHTDRNMSWSFI